MKKKLIGILLLILLTVSVHSQIDAPLTFTKYDAKSELPSEQTYKQIEEMSGTPGLRAAPPGEEGDGGAQKVPSGNTTLIQLSILSLLFMYCKKQQNKTSNENI